MVAILIDLVGVFWCLFVSFIKFYQAYHTEFSFVLIREVSNFLLDYF